MKKLLFLTFLPVIVLAIAVPTGNAFTYLYLLAFPLITLFFALTAYLLRRHEMRRIANPEKDNVVVLHAARMKINII